MRLTKITKEEKANLPNSPPMGELIFANEYLDQKVYVCNIGSGLVQENISDTVHPNYEGHTKMARNLAGVIQYTHN